MIGNTFDHEYEDWDASYWSFNFDSTLDYLTEFENDTVNLLQVMGKNRFATEREKRRVKITKPRLLN